jgi:hypothetical protein
MRRFYSWLLFICVFPPVIYSQELEIATNHYSPDFYVDHGFSNRYQVNYYSDYSLPRTSHYKQKKVKKVELYNTYNQVCWMAELDTAGKITKSGIRGYYYFIVTESYIGPNKEYITITKYFDQQKLVRADTSVSVRFSFQRADTAMSFTRTTHKIYKRGELINEQNIYYNETYLNKPVLASSNSPWVMISLYGEDPDKPKVYFKEKLATHYDTAKLYYCQTKTFDHDFYASVDSGAADLRLEQIATHPFVKKYRNNEEANYFVDGESFEEPSQYHEAMRCGSYYYHQQHQDDGFSYGYTTNEKG